MAAVGKGGECSEGMFSTWEHALMHSLRSLDCTLHNNDWESLGEPHANFHLE